MLFKPGYCTVEIVDVDSTSVAVQVGQADVIAVDFLGSLHRRNAILCLLPARVLRSFLPTGDGYQYQPVFNVVCRSIHSRCLNIPRREGGGT